MPDTVRSSITRHAETTKSSLKRSPDPDTQLSDPTSTRLPRKLLSRAMQSLALLIVAHTWARPKHANLEEADISFEKKASLGSIAVPIYRNPADGKVYALVAEAGRHYSAYPEYNTGAENLMVAGGFGNLADTEAFPGLIKAQPGVPETDQITVVRELAEEFVGPDGRPLLKICPERLEIVDSVTLLDPQFGHVTKATAYSFILSASEFELASQHTQRQATDSGYLKQCSELTVNPSSGEPEVSQLYLLPLADLATGRHHLLYPRNKLLFMKLLARTEGQDPLHIWGG